MMMFDKLCRKRWSSSAHRTETVTTMGHERSVTVTSIGLNQTVADPGGGGHAPSLAA